jgi:hypothetical protein
MTAAAVPIEADHQPVRLVLLSISAVVMAAFRREGLDAAHLGYGGLRSDPLIFRHA